ncbi:gamma-glutamyl-gamma-aminobutyrate hydrolase family protein [Sphaerotilus microaerophilus]|jgi:putative glutamine amidotransferase|uniref:Glutamine amidotransferase n=1 Tax=Sphaerotilus microaerophilus TaxID=2914710 RepID=A0ABM7YMW5_9BURK|nr:gamma-glutamyl-gamma-aminobutyrate hydrolase family protein [Sphaerotilus sp. FB-5]BDI05797.1 glutamine amidotransferase [Sphaerotilus sp. FB-5]
MSTLPPSSQPLVLVPACNRMLGQHPFHVAGKKYVDAVRLAGALPLVVPSASPAELDVLLDLADGVLLTGSPSNVHPSHYGEEVYDQRLPLDPVRDDWTLPLIPKALQRGIPLLAICRGFQEANVALGGSLHQAVQEVPGKHDHRAPEAAPAEVQYAASHPIVVQRGGWLERLFGVGAELQVNSVHGQGVNRLADGLRVEALAPDGLVEAFSTVPTADTPGFALCVQWHPEWLAADNPVSMALLRAFGAACQDYRDTHRPPDR